NALRQTRYKFSRCNLSGCFCHLAQLMTRPRSWALPLRHERITSWDSPIEKAVGQLKKVCELMPSRPISVWDSE
ncbi:MAG: transposase, partial [Nostoc sp.]